MTQHPPSTIQLQRMLCACIYAVLLCAFLGVVSDTRAQTNAQVFDALDISTADRALINRVSTTLPSGVTLPQEGASATVATIVGWRVSSIAATEGDNSMRSGAVSDAEGSCLVLEVMLPDTRQLRFSLRTSSQGQYDRLAFFIDDQTVISNFSAPEDSITREWEQQSFVVTSDVSNLSWCYLKNGGDNMQGDDAGWLDNLSFITPSPVCPILDMSDEECGLITATRYDPPGNSWTANSIATEGSDSLRSDLIPSRSQQSCLILNVSLPDRTLVQFFRQVRADPPDDLYFSVDNVRQEYSLRPAATTFFRDWSREVHILFESGDKTLRWCSVRDASSQISGLAWIDDLSLIAPPAAPLNRDVVCLVLDMSLEDCERITSYASVPPDPAWYISYFNSEGGFSNGETSLRSDPAVDDNRFSCLVLGVTLPADTLIGFALRSDSEGGRDFLYFEADGVRLIENFSAPLNSSIRDFELLEFEVTNPVSNLRWCYQKDAILSVGDDSVWLDRLYFIPPGEARPDKEQVCAALDMSDQDCARISGVSTLPPNGLILPDTSGTVSLPADIPWFVSPVATEGDNSLRSGNIGHGQASCLVLGVTVSAGTRISFSLRTNSEPQADRLIFAADNQLLIENFSATTGSTSLRDWEPQGFNAPSSISNLSWCYLKDAGESSDADSGWLDDLSFTTLSAGLVCQALDMSARDCGLITGISTTLPAGLTLPTIINQTSTPGDIPWFVSPVATDGDTSLRSGDIDHSEATCLVLEVSLPAGTVIRFSLRASAEAVVDRLTFAADAQTLIINFSVLHSNTFRDWEAQEVTLSNSVGNLSWCYLKDSVISLEEDSVWLDALSFTLPLAGLVCAALDMSVDDCARITGVSTTLPTGLTLPRTPLNNLSPVDVPWLVSSLVSLVSFEGDTSLRSGDITHNQASCLVLTTALPAGTEIHFALRTSSEPQSDRLIFAADNQLLLENFSAASGSINALSDWELLSFNAASSISNLSWCYAKNATRNAGLDIGWLDTLSFTVPLTPATPLTRERICRVLDMSTEDCTMITHFGTDPAAPSWVISNTNSEGDNSLRSDPKVDHNETSCLVLGVALPGDRTIRFFLRTDSEGGNDFLYFEADGARLIRNFSAPLSSIRRDFEAVNVFLAGDISKLVWCYTKSRFTDAGADSGWLDRLSFSAAGARTTIALTPGLVCQALNMSTDNCGLIDSVAADPPGRPWVLSAIATEGSLSLRSGDIDDSQTSCLVLGIALPGDRNLRFSLRSDSEAVNDFLYFEADGTRLVDRFSARQGSTVRDWEQLDVLISNSISSLKWCYTKNGSTSAGEDSGWLDALTFTVPGVTKDALCTALDMSDDDCALISSVSTILPPDLMLVQQLVDVPWTVSMAVGNQGGNSLRSGDIDHSEASCLVLGVTLPINTLIRFSLRASSEGLFDHLTFAADSQTVIENFSHPLGANNIPTTFEQREYTASAPVSNLTWCYQKNGSINFLNDAGWLDTLSFAVPLSIASFCSVLDLGNRECARVQSVSFEPPDLPWLISSTATQGNTSLRSPDIGDSEQSCLALTLSLIEPLLIQFSRRVSSQPAADRLFITLNGNELNYPLRPEADSVLRDWSREAYLLPSANDASILRWCYAKDGSTSQGEDSAWIDNLSLDVAETAPLARGGVDREVLCLVLDINLEDCTRITNSVIEPTGADWGISLVATEGDYSLRSQTNPGNLINGNQTSCLVLEIALPVSIDIRFSVRTDSEPVNDYLYFEANGQRLIDRFTAMEGETLRDWEQQQFSLPAGNSILRWCYTKNNLTEDGQGEDSAWVDALSFTTLLSIDNVCLALDLSTGECAQITDVTFDPPDLSWLIATDTSVAGASSLRSGDIDDSEQSCLVLELALSPNSVITLASRTSSQGGFDQLQVSTDRLRLDTLSAAIDTTEKPWGHTTYYLPAAATALRWCYVKDSADSSGEDSVWIDNLSFSTSNISYQSRLYAALDLSETFHPTVVTISWDPRNLPWVITSQTSVLGGTSLRSPDLGDDERSCLSLLFPSIPLPANTVIRFSLRADSEAVNDFLSLEPDTGTLLDNFSATNGSLRDWEPQEIRLASNTNNLIWCYEKNGSISSGEDAVWLDALSVTNTLLSIDNVCLALDLSTEECAQITDVTFDPPDLSWRITTDTSVAGASSLRSADIDDSEQSCLVLELALSPNSVITLASRTSSQGGFDQLQVSMDRLRLDTLSAAIDTTEKPWAHTTYYLPAAAAALRWCYVKDSADSSGEDSVWIDNLSFSTSNISYQSRLYAALDLSETFLPTRTFISWSPPNLLWVITSQTSVLGGTSLRSPDFGDDEAGCLNLTLPSIPLPVNTVLRFSLRADSEAVNDFLSFTPVTGTLIDNFSATNGSLRDWEPQEIRLASSSLSLHWCYNKNASISSGEDAVWLDALSIIIPLTTEDVCLALDLSSEDCALITSVATEPPQSLWLISPIATEGDTALRSGDIDDDQQSCLVLNLSPLTERTLVQFSLRISSEPLADRLLFAADGQFLDYNLRPEPNAVLRDWSRQLSIVPAGTTSLSWCYRKNDSVSEGEDSIWIDELSISATSVAALTRELVCLVLDINTEDCGIIRSVAFDPPASPWLIATTATEGDFSLRSADIDDSESSCLVLGIALSVDSDIRFSLRTDSEAVNDHLSFAAGGQELIETFAAADGSTLRDWEPQQFFLPVGNSTLRWCYNKNGSTSSGADSGWLDALSFTTAGLESIEPLCEALDLFQAQCAIIRSVTYNPPQTPWLTTATESARGGSALVSPVPGSDESSCLTVEFYSPLTPDSPVVFDWRTTSPSAQDILQFQVGDQQSQIAAMPEWQTQTVDLNSAETTMGWCYSRNSAADGQTARAWLDNLSLLTLIDRYTVQITVIPTSVLLTEDSDGFRFQVAVTAVSETLPPPTDWVLVIAGMDNITAADTTYALVFSDGAAQVDAIATFDDPLLPSSILLSLEDRPSLINTTTGTSLAVQLPAARRLETLEIITSTSVTQSAPDAMFVIAVTVAATDNFGEPLEPTGLTLMVEDSGNAEVSQSDYALNFVDGSATTTITVGLTRRGDEGSIELSVASGDIQSAVSITLNPAPRVLVSITLSAASSNLSQTTANTAVSAVLMLTALDNYGDPIEAGDINLQIEATNDAIVTSSLTVAIATTATVLQMVEILPQNELDTTVTVLISRGTLDESVQLLPDGGIQIAVRVLRVLRQLQLGLVNRVSPLRQIDRSLPIRANIRLIGLDQFGQPSAFSEVMLTATAEPMATTATLNPPQLTATGPEGAQTLLEVSFPGDSTMATTITIAIEGTDAGVSTNSLVVQALPDPRPPIRPLHVDDPETDVTELDLIVALRWLIDQQASTASLVVNLTIPSTDITTDGIKNLQQLFTQDIDRIDVNGDGRADQLDLRILVRWLSGLRGTELAEQDVFEDLIRLLLNRQP